MQLTPLRVAVIITNGYGDHLLALPAIRALGSLFGKQLMLVLLEDCAPLIRVPNIRYVRVNVKSREELNSPETSLKISRRLGKLDVLISFDRFRSQFVENLKFECRPTATVGFFQDFDIYVPLNHNTHSVDLAFEMPLQFNSLLALDDFTDVPQILSAGSLAQKAIRNMLRGAALLVVHAESSREKMWSEKKFGLVLEDFLDARPEYCAVIIGKESTCVSLSTTHSRVIQLLCPPLEVAMGIIAISKIFVGIDSLMLHISDFFRISSVGIFGHPNPVEFGFRFCKHEYVFGNGNTSSIQRKSVLDALINLSSAH